MRLKIKVCGMKHEENIRAVAALMPAYLGFIFYPSSPRYVGSNFSVPAGLPQQAGRVGVFVNENPQIILNLARLHQLTHLQLHGDEPVSHCYFLRRHGFKIIKAFGIHPEFDFSTLRSYTHVVDFFLFDTHTRHYGGSGKVFNWELLKHYNHNIPFFLSGGLSVEVLRTIALPRHPCLYALDVNSGVEERPGVKNVAAIRELLQTISSINL